MLRVGALMAALLFLAPATGYPTLGRRLGLWEACPGCGVKYQQVSVATAKNGAYKTSVNMILDQSAQRRSSRDFKSFKRNLEIPRKNGYMNCQRKSILKCVIFNKRKLCLIACKIRSIYILRRHLGTNKLILEGQIESRKRRNNIFKNGKFQVKMNCHSIFKVRIKSDTKRTEQLQIYVENKYIETEPYILPLLLQANMIVKSNNKCVLKSQEVFKSIMGLKLKQTILKLKQHIDAGMQQKKKYKQNNNKMLYYDREFSRKNRNAYNKVHYGMFTNIKKAFNSKKKCQCMRFWKYGFLSQRFQWSTSFLIREKMKVWKQKTMTKKIINENCTFPFVYACTYQRNSDDVQKMFSAHKIVLSNVQGKVLFAFQRKMYRNKKLIEKWSSVQMQPTVTHLAFPTIKIAIGVCRGEFNSQVDPAKPSVHMTKVLKYLMQSSQRVKQYFNVNQKRHRIKSLKALMVRNHLDTEDSFPTFLYLCKYISDSPLVVERSKRSAEEENEPIPVDFLKRLTSALIAGATIFGLAVFALALTACYLYDKRRKLGQFFDKVLKDGKPGKNSKYGGTQSSKPISISQNFHSAQPQESRRNQTTLALAAAAEPYSKEESDFVIEKKIYGSSVTGSSSETLLDHSGLTVKSRAFVFPSRSRDSIYLSRDNVSDVSSAQHSLSDAIKMENHFSNPRSTIPKEKELVPVVPQMECLSDNQEQCTSSDLLPQSKNATDSSQLCLSGEITVENQFLDLPTTTLKEKEVVPVVPQTDCLYDNKEQCMSSDLETHSKKATDSSQLCLSGEITIENQFLDLSTTTPKEKEVVPVVPQTDCLCDNKEQCMSSDLEAQPKKATDSSQLCLSGEITIENQFSNLSTTPPKEKELVPVVTQPENSLCHNQEQCTSDVLQVKRISISKSKSENDIMASSRVSHAVQSLTHISKCP